MTLRRTHTYAIMGLSTSAWDEIKANLLAAGYDHAVQRESGGTELLMMDGIALAAIAIEAVSAKPIRIVYSPAESKVKQGAVLRAQRRAMGLDVYKAMKCLGLSLMEIDGLEAGMYDCDWDEAVRRLAECP